MVSATPDASVRGQSTSALEAKGVRGLRRHAARPQVADPVIEASVSHLDATPDMPLVDLLWYPHCASAVELCTPDLHAVEIQVDDRCRVQRQHLAEDQATDDGDAQRPAQLRAGAHTECQGQSAQ